MSFETESVAAAVNAWNLLEFALSPGYGGVTKRRVRSTIAALEKLADGVSKERNQAYWLFTRIEAVKRLAEVYRARAEGDDQSLLCILKNTLSLDQDAKLTPDKLQAAFRELRATAKETMARYPRLSLTDAIDRAAHNLSEMYRVHFPDAAAASIQLSHKNFRKLENKTKPVHWYAPIDARRPTRQELTRFILERGAGYHAEKVEKALAALKGE